MKTKKMIINAILIAIGVMLHILAPSIGLPIQPDFAVAMMIIIIMLNKDYKTAVFVGIILGIFTAMTTKSPGGQIPNIIDKIVTSNIVYLVSIPLRDRVNKNILLGGLQFFGTIISGTVFLVSLFFIGNNLPVENIIPIFAAVVLPTAALNLIIGLVIYKVVERTMKITGFKI